MLLHSRPNETTVAAVAPAGWSCGRDAWWKKRPQPRCLLNSTASPRHPVVKTVAAAPGSIAISKHQTGKNRHPSGRTETEGIAKILRPFETSEPHWPPTFQTRHKTHWNRAESPSTRAPQRWNLAAAGSAGIWRKVWPNHPSSWKLLQKWWSHIYVSDSDKKHRSNRSVIHRIVVKKIFISILKLTKFHLLFRRNHTFFVALEWSLGSMFATVKFIGVIYWCIRIHVEKIISKNIGDHTKRLKIEPYLAMAPDNLSKNWWYFEKLISPSVKR